MSYRLRSKRSVTEPNLSSIKWQPVVLTFTFSSKDSKGGKDPLIAIRGRLEDLDIKTITPFVRGKTTHVVASKRNTAKSLQALIHATFLVNHRFLDALEYATAPDNLNEPESLSPLESDFDSAWPNALEYLPDPGKEPNQRPVELFAPDSGRENVFRGYSFVFFDPTQCDTLKSAITEGGGQALYFPINFGQTTGDEIAQHVKGVVSQGKGVLQVRFSGKGHEEWAIRVQKESMVATGQELIEQNEFLDAILLKNAAALLRPISIIGQDPGTAEPEQHDLANTQSRARSASTHNEHREGFSTRRRSNQQGPTQESYGDDLPSQPQATRGSSNQRSSEPQAETATRPTRPNRFRGTTVRAFTGFEDDAPQAIEPMDYDESFDNASPADPTDAYSLYQVISDRGMEADAPTENKKYAESRKRRSPPDHGAYDEDDLFPAQTAVKRRRLEEERDAREHGRPTPSEEKAAKAKQQIEKKKVKEINVEETLRKKRQEERDAEEDEEPMSKYLENMTVEDMQSLAIVEEIEIQEKIPAAERNRDKGDRWDERWNGRKNFKKFRRRGQNDAPRRAQTVIVPLEEVRNSDFGVQDNFWAEKEKAREQRKKKALTREETDPSQSYTDAPSHQEEIPAELMDGAEPDIIDVDAPRTTRQSERGQTQASTGRSQAASRKRTAPRSAAASTNKRQKKLDLMLDKDEGSSEEEVPKFRLRKKGG